MSAADEDEDTRAIAVATAARLSVLEAGDKETGLVAHVFVDFDEITCSTI